VAQLVKNLLGFFEEELLGKIEGGRRNAEYRILYKTANTLKLSSTHTITHMHTQRLNQTERN